MKRSQLQQGVTSVEYALLAASIALAIVGALSAVGTENGGLWAAWTARVLALISP